MPSRLSTKEFIQKANKIHHNQFDYSMVQYQSAHIDVCIIDVNYGKFWQSPANHLKGHGHPFNKKKGNKRLTTKIFIEKANKIHKNLYDYTKCIYKHSHEKICIIDPEHGEFWQRASTHLAGGGNPLRAHTKTSPTHKDHIIPLSIITSRKTVNIKRPLYKFLNSKLNLQEIPSGKNNAKSDWININGKQLRARTVRNNYQIIKQLAEQLLNVNIDHIIEEDKHFNRYS